jgi:hypothetical protein
VAIAPSAVPASYDELALRYRDYVIRLVRKQGIPPQDAEDAADDILLSEMTARNRAGEPVGILALYDPSHTAEHQGVTKAVSFKAFLSARVALRCRGRRDAIQRRAAREIPASGPAGDRPESWMELFGPQAWDDYSHLDAEEFTTRMRELLARQPRRSPTDSCDLVALFDELSRQVHEHGFISNAKVGQRFGIGDTTVTAWLARLRQIMRRAGDALPAPESLVIGGVKLTLADIHSAVRILKEAKGIMVRQPLERAGHPLAQAGKGWYHPFSKEEIASFPEIAIDPQTHRKPAGHVKIAVLHRLERMLGAAMAETPAPREVVPDPEPDPDPTPEEILEARLWSAGIPNAAVLERVKAVVAEYACAPVSVA